MINQDRVFVRVEAGMAASDESRDWTEMIFLMLKRYCELQGWNVEVLGSAARESEVGVIMAVFSVTGEHVEHIYEHMRSEIGIHKLVRISPFDTTRRRYTSFASVFIRWNYCPEEETVKNLIRTYTFQPYQLIKDHRTNCETSEIDQFLNGNIGGFIETYLAQEKK